MTHIIMMWAYRSSHWTLPNAILHPRAPRAATINHLCMEGEVLESSSRAASISFLSYPLHPCSPAALRRTISANFAVASSLSFSTTAVSGSVNSSELLCFAGFELSARIDEVTYEAVRPDRISKRVLRNEARRREYLPA